MCSIAPVTGPMSALVPLFIDSPYKKLWWLSRTHSAFSPTSTTSTR